MDNYTVYMHISPSGKRYIGITCRKPKHRWNNGKGYEGNKYFYSAINKYGWDNFEHIIIAKGLDGETAKWLEIELIKEWYTTNKNYGYNITLGGEGGNGYKHTEEFKKRMSERRGKNNPNYGKPLTVDHKRKISEANRGKNNPNYGKHLPEETKKKMSEAKKGKVCSEEVKRKISKTQKGKYIGENNPMAKIVICITTGKIFYTAKEGAEYYNCSNSNICQNCKRNRESAGKLPDGTPLVWRYIEIIEL